MRRIASTMDSGVWSDVIEKNQTSDWGSFRAGERLKQKPSWREKRLNFRLSRCGLNDWLSHSKVRLFRGEVLWSGNVRQLDVLERTTILVWKEMDTNLHRLHGRRYIFRITLSKKRNTLTRKWRQQSAHAKTIVECLTLFLTCLVNKLKYACSVA